MSAISVSQCALTEPWQSQFLSVLPVVQTHARIRFRDLRAEQREEATQEAVASACVAFQLLASRGKPHAATPSTLATFAVKHVRSGRHVGGSKDPVGDVLSPVVRRRLDVTVMSFLGHSAESGDWRRVTGHRNVSIPDLAAFRVDFAQWLQLFATRDQDIITALAGGDTTNSVAQRFNLSAARISQLRSRYRHSWRVFQGELPAKAQAG